MKAHLDDQLSAYLDDELIVEDRLAVEAHLESCEYCQALLDDWLSMQEQVQVAFQSTEAPISFEINVMQAIQDEQQVSVSKSWLILPLFVLFVIIMLGIAKGMMFIKLIHSSMRLSIALLYMVTHFMSSIPILAITAVFLSIAILTTSIYYLRRAIRLTSVEGG
ncbi:zf-HC2 domain-containing protein [Paenibacillus sp. PR3]|uniref:Anti-sigma-W factor RsiW n=1 Tax=Paenibacillus terricola TaxID=2763503 RepID=A0ABR8MT84_9BACL|nr:zf-HC2 domain-containing protein [Paenibacillus terricola]MBD3919175.1 zf-HC2 domain-containing protein [Paenibacillus terricola]